GVAAGASLRTDAWAITAPVSLDLSDGQPDATLLPLIGTPGDTMDVTAALDGAGTLYLSTNLADLGSDHLAALWIRAPHATETVPAPWGKSGTLAGPHADGHLLVLMQEEATQYCEWRRWDDGLAS